MSEALQTPPWIARQAHGLLQQRGHAWLLEGPAGLGQYGLALALARAWLCEKPGEGGACGQCASCHAIDVRTHADLCVLMPETWMLDLGWPLSEKAQADLDDKKRKPSKEIRVEAMREAVEFCQRTSARGRGKAQAKTSEGRATSHLRTHGLSGRILSLSLVLSVVLCS